MQETIILQGVCNRIKGAFVENGHAMLTNQRFIYSKHSFAKIAVMGALVNLTKGDFDFDIPIADITDIEGNVAQSVPVQSVADELLKFKSLLDAGAITEDEYNAQKAKLLNP